MQNNFPKEISIIDMATFSNTRTKPKVAAARGAAKPKNIWLIFRTFYSLNTKWINNHYFLHDLVFNFAVYFIY